MEWQWLDDTALALPGAQKDYKAEWEAHRYLVGGKMFGMLGAHKDGRPIITLKLPPADGLLLRGQYPDVIPGYYMNKEHWNSVYLDGAVPRDVVEKMIRASYGLIAGSLPKNVREGLLPGGEKK